jgi:branched-chain amino acid aminotransferase
MAASNEWVVWFNGSVVPEREARVPFRDRGFKYGDAVFDTTRTFGHRIFRLDDHLERLYRSLAYLDIDPGLLRGQLREITEAVAAHNLKLTPPDEDIWVSQRVTRGIEPAERQAWPDYPERTVIVECRPLPFRGRAKFYRKGLELVIPSVRRPAPDTLSPRAKMQNYINLVLADLEVKAQNPEAQAILLDTNGNIAEGRGSNVFFVRNGVLLTPKERYVLPGVSRQTAIDLARTLGIPVEEADLDLYDAVTADEAFITSSSWCICPASSINGRRIGGGTVPGPVTKRLMDAYVELVGCDWVGQYLKYANE